MKQTIVLFVTAVAAVACSNRDAVWDHPAPSPLQAYGLTSSVAIVDDPAHRVLVLSAGSDQTLDAASLSIGHSALSAAASPDGQRLFVLAAGDVPRRTERDEYPSLTVIEDGGAAPKSTRFPMAEPLGNIAIDPQGRWAAAFAGDGKSTAFVQNPNEIVLFDLSAPPGPNNPIPRTIRSFGGRPQRLTFTPTLTLPGGPRRLLVIETQEDVTLLDLDHAGDTPPRPEITVRLTSGGDARVLKPAGVVVDDGEPSRNDDARVGVRIANDTSVFTLQLGASAAGSANDFSPSVNLTDVGGVPTDIAFVRTPQLRVAAMVPTIASAVLIDPETSVTEAVSLPEDYSRLSVVTDIVASGVRDSDVALLWSASSATGGVAFWTLGKTGGEPYRSVDVLGLEDSVSGVRDVPQPNAALKLLEASAGFYVLNLRSRTAAPLNTLERATLVPSPDGARVWALRAGATELASLDLGTLHPIPLTTDQPIASGFDIARADGGRAFITLHDVGSGGATVFDALSPDTATARSYAALLSGGL